MSRTTEQILDHHLTALSSGNVEATMSDYAPDAVLITPEKVVKGTQELLVHFTNSVKVLPPDTKLEIIDKKCVGNIAFIVWKAENKFLNFKFASDTMVIENDKIVSQTFVAIVERK